MQRAEELTRLRQSLKNKINHLRALENIIDDDFTDEFLNATDTEQINLLDAIRKEDKVNIHVWMKLRSQKETMRVLRTAASSLGIPYYTQMSKGQLLLEIEKANGIKNKSSSGIGQAIGPCRGDNGATDHKPAS